MKKFLKLESFEVSWTAKTAMLCEAEICKKVDERRSHSTQVEMDMEV